jgi:type II secretory pathway component PulM
MNKDTGTLRVLLPLLALVLLLAVWMQFSETQERNAELQQTQSQLQQLQQSMLRYNTLQGNARKNWQVFDSNQELAAWLKQNLSSNSPIRGSVKEANGQVSIKLAKVPFSQLVQWLQYLQVTSNVQVINMSLTATSKSAVVDGLLQLSLRFPDN